MKCNRASPINLRMSGAGVVRQQCWNGSTRRKVMRGGSLETLRQRLVLAGQKRDLFRSGLPSVQRITKTDQGRLDFLQMCYYKANDEYEMAMRRNVFPQGDRESDRFLALDTDQQRASVRTFLNSCTDVESILDIRSTIARNCPILAEYMTQYIGYTRMEIGEFVVNKVLDIVLLNQAALSEFLGSDACRLVNPDVTPDVAQLRDRRIVRDRRIADALFAMLDADGSGGIEFDEVEALFYNIGVQNIVDRELFRSFDTDGDRSLDRGGFLMLMQHVFGFLEDSVKDRLFNAIARQTPTSGSTSHASDATSSLVKSNPPPPTSSPVRPPPGSYEHSQMPDPDSMIPGTAHTYRELGQCFAIDPSKVDDVIRRNGASTARQVHDAARALINRPLGFQIMAECARHGTGMNWDSIRNPSQRELDALRVQMTNDLHMWLSRSDDRRFRSNHCRRSVIDGMVTKMLDNIAFDTLEQSNFRLAVLAFEFLKCQPPAFQTEWAKLWTRDNIESYTGTLERFTADDILPLPNEDFGRIDKRGNQDFRSTFKGCEYSIWATNHCEVYRKSGFHLLSILPKSSFGEHTFHVPVGSSSEFSSSLVTFTQAPSHEQTTTCGGKNCLHG
jgi:hypothetical protein